MLFHQRMNFVKKKNPHKIQLHFQKKSVEKHFGILVVGFSFPVMIEHVIPRI